MNSNGKLESQDVFLTKIANKTKFYCIEIGDQKICLKKVSQFLKMLDLNSYKYLCPNITVQFCADKTKVISLKKEDMLRKGNTNIYIKPLFMEVLIFTLMLSLRK